MRELKNQEFVPKWFDQTDQVAPTPWGDLEIYEYNGKYNEHRAAVDSSGTVEEVNFNATEFNPWQFGNVAETKWRKLIYVLLVFVCQLLLLVV